MNEATAARLVVTGTGTIVPEKGRACSSVCLRAAGSLFLVDCGPGVLSSMAGAGLDYRDIDHVILSHLHADHTLGLPRLFSALKNDRRARGDAAVSLTGPEGTGAFLKALDAAWPGVASGVETDLREVGGGETLSLGGVEIATVDASHGGVPALSFRIGAGGGAFVYTGDTGLTGELIRLSSGVGLLVSECSTPDEERMDSHMSPSDVSRLAVQAGVGRIVLLHIYPGSDREAMARAVAEASGLPVSLAGEGDEFDLS